MNWETKKALLIAAGLFAVGLMVWPGCATPPLPSKRQPIAMRKAADFKVPKKSHPTRSEIIERLGQPDAYVNDIHVAGYRINQVTRRNVFLCLFIIPIDVVKNTNYADVAFFQFDDTDRLTRSGKLTTYARDARSLENAARRWLEAETKTKK